MESKNSVKPTIINILNQMSELLNDIDDNTVNHFINMIVNSRSIFLVGAGRSGLVAKAFAMRLMHLGFNVYVVGETITPAVKPGDLVIAVSGSGETKSTLIVAQTAKELGVKVVAITSFPESSLGKIADCVVKIKGRGLKKDMDYLSGQLRGTHEPLTPLGTLFELSSLVFFDAVITALMDLYRIEERDLRIKHTNLE